ncbi:MAG: hypothetical protein NTZ80_04175, partial [Patescibacteria group bacterium]|nr:hypothetical protein [Patescibacteria group bacterium]
RSEITEIKEFFAIMANEKNGYQIMKGLAEKIARSLEIFDLSFESQKYSGPIPIKKYVSIISNGIKIGTISEASVIAKNLDVKSEPVYAFKFYIKTLLEAVPEEQRKFKALPEFPAVKRDLAFTVDKKLLVGKLIEAIKTCSSLVESVEIFDIYEGEKIADSKKSVALSVSLRHAEKTLSDADIKSATDLILQAVSKVGGELRK